MCAYQHALLHLQHALTGQTLAIDSQQHTMAITECASCKTLGRTHALSVTGAPQFRSAAARGGFRPAAHDAQSHCGPQVRAPGGWPTAWTQYLLGIPVP